MECNVEMKNIPETKSFDLKYRELINDAPVKLQKSKMKII
jgi:hypothetical protein